MKLSLTKSVALSGFLMLAVAGVVASADPVVNGTFSTPASSSVSWGTLNNSTVGGPGTVDWGSGEYGYSPTNIDGWTFSPFVTGSSGAGIADDGSAFGFTDPTSGAGQVAFIQQNASISQTITGLTVGQEYVLLFNLEGRPSTGGDDVSVSLGGDPLLTPTLSATGVWTAYEEAFTASATSEVLLFSSTVTNDEDMTTAIDDVQILTPEPGSILLFATGILGFAFMMRRKAVAARMRTPRN